MTLENKAMGSAIQRASLGDEYGNNGVIFISPEMGELKTIEDEKVFDGSNKEDGVNNTEVISKGKG